MGNYSTDYWSVKGSAKKMGAGQRGFPKWEEESSFAGPQVSKTETWGNTAPLLGRDGLRLQPFHETRRLTKIVLERLRGGECAEIS